MYQEVVDGTVPSADEGIGKVVRRTDGTGGVVSVPWVRIGVALRRRRQSVRILSSPAMMGRLEETVMEIVWAAGESSVHEVAGRLPRPLAYTTVMTTLDRLYKKGLLERRKVDRAFVYAPAMTKAQWERKRAGDFLASFPTGHHDLLISCLVDAVGEHDAALLDELERKIRRKRRELGRS